MDRAASAGHGPGALWRRTGVTRWLVSQGAVVTVTDQAAPEALAEPLEEIAGLPVELALGGHALSLLDQADLVVVNPAVVKPKSQFFQELSRRGVPWTTETNLFCERCPGYVLA